MLLGSTANSNTTSGTESLVIQLFLQHRYAEVYELLNEQQSTQTSVLYNKALCLYWSSNYQAALIQLDGIKLAPQLNNGNKLNSISEYTAIRNKQNETNDHLHAMSDAYVNTFPHLVHDAIVRLKTDCWLHVGNYANVVAVAAPIAHKGYKNITDALKLADTANDKRI
jgi:hypothetical protein